MKQSRHWLRALVALPLVALGAFACAPPKVLVNHSYASSDKSIQAFIQKSGATVGTGDNQTELFNVFMRVCNQAENNTTAECKDTLILENVNPKSL